MGKENDKIIGDFLFEDFKKNMKEKDEKQVMELMCRHFEFYGQMNSQNIEYALRGAKLSCTHGNKYIQLDMARDHGIYDGEDALMVCGDCILHENIYDFGACGNGKFEPVYSKDAPPPGRKTLNKNGQERHICLPVLLGEWGCGSIDSRSLLISVGPEGKMYEKESFDGEGFSQNTIEQIAQEQSKNAEEDAEYSQALMTCDNLLCLYGGVITIEENPFKMKREQSSIRKTFNVGNNEINIRACSEEIIAFLKCYERGGIRATIEDEMKYLNEGEPAVRMYYDSANKPTIGWGHLIVGNGEYVFLNGVTKNLYKDELSLAEAEEIFQTDITIKQTDLNQLLDKLDLSVTQREYDVLLSLTFNTGTGALTDDQAYPQTKKWFETQGYKDKEYSKFILGDIINGGDDGLKARRLDELEILLNKPYERDEGDLDRVLSEDGESIWLRKDKINELAEIWKSSPDYKGDHAENENQ